jgi:hypothetical protein
MEDGGQATQFGIQFLARFTLDPTWRLTPNKTICRAHAMAATPVYNGAVCQPHDSTFPKPTSRQDSHCGQAQHWQALSESLRPVDAHGSKSTTPAPLLYSIQ